MKMQLCCLSARPDGVATSHAFDAEGALAEVVDGEGYETGPVGHGSRDFSGIFDAWHHV